jgi:glycolate oxidase
MQIKIDRLESDLRSILGAENVLSDKPSTFVYAKDVMPYDLEDQNIPFAVVRPGNSMEVSQVLKYANEHKIPVHIHGSGTSLVGLARPKAKGIVLDTARMAKINIYPDRGYFEAGPGAHLSAVRKELLSVNAMLPIFPGSELVATIGGTIAVNTSAHAVDASLGKPGDYVLGLEVVLADGSILETGTESMRKPAGIELTKFLVGSEGLLCVVTKVRMRLIPQPFFSNIVGYYRSTEDILSTVMAMYKECISPPMFFEYLDEKSAKVGFKAVGLSEPVGAVAMMSMHSWSQSGCEDKAERFLKFMKVGKPIDSSIVRESAEWDKIWSSRAEAGNYVYRLGLSFGSEVTPRVDKLMDAFLETRSSILNLKSLKNPEFYSFGHIGAPTIHGYAFFPTKNISSDVRKEIVKEVREITEGLNVKYGGCGGEWGLTAQRVSFLKKKYQPAYYEVLTKIKKALDPNNILNRGNLEGWM